MPTCERSTRDCPQRAEWEGVVDVIDQRGLVGSDRLDPVRVFPAFEWPGHLHVGELLSLDEVAVQGFPPGLDWASSQLEGHPAAVGDPAVAGDDPQMFPGWSEALEGARTGVPGKKGGRRGVDNRSLFVNWHVSSGPQRRLGRRIARIWRVPANIGLHGHLSRGVL